MAISNGWGGASTNNTIGWGKATNNTIGWGKAVNNIIGWGKATSILIHWGNADLSESIASTLSNNRVTQNGDRRVTTDNNNRVIQ